MKCIYCDSYETKVRNTGKSEDSAVYRERVCMSCRKIFYTKETSSSFSEQMKFKAELQKARLG